ncbi:hypothetical protein J6590_003416 [Homalodisca vitripennis]|nr:hypothetical protein J6590_003416 [Homalodisca vitripennis]
MNFLNLLQASCRRDEEEWREGVLPLIISDLTDGLHSLSGYEFPMIVLFEVYGWSQGRLGESSIYCPIYLLQLGLNNIPIGLCSAASTSDPRISDSILLVYIGTRRTLINKYLKDVRLIAEPRGDESSERSGPNRLDIDIDVHTADNICLLSVKCTADLV